MKKHLISIFILIAYSVILIKVMVFKDIPTIRMGHLMLNFGGTDAGHSANFVPFKTIVPYLFGYKGLIIAGVNLVGNIALLVPIGFLVPLVYRNMTWKKSLIIAIVSGLAIETMQTVLRVGIFDIDDVILNALGVMIGYFMLIILTKWGRERKYKNIIIAAIIFIAAVAAAFYFVYPWGQPLVNSRVGAGDQFDNSAHQQEDETPESSNLCGDTGGNGQIISVGNNKFTIERNDGSNQIINLIAEISIKTSAGAGSISDLKIGDRVTLVGGPNPDGSFTADAVFVCN